MPIRLILTVFILSACEQKPPVHQTQEAKVVENYLDQVTAVGRLRSAEQAFIAVKNGGSLDALHVKQGDQVQQNQILAVIDKETRTANLERALSNFKLAKAEYRRIHRLFRNGSTTRSDLDKAEAEQSVKEAELKVAREELNDALVRSPIAGKIVYFAFSLGDIIPDGSRLAVIENPDVIEMRVKIPFNDAEKVLSEEQVGVSRYDLSKRESSGENTTVPVKITRIQQASDYDSSYAELKLAFLEKSPYQPGDLVFLTLYRRQYDKLWSIPNEAIFSRENAEWILSKDANGALHKTVVKIIASKGGYSLIKEYPTGQSLVLPQIGDTWQAFLKHETIRKLF